MFPTTPCRIMRPIMEVPALSFARLPLRVEFLPRALLCALAGLILAAMPALAAAPSPERLKAALAYEGELSIDGRRLDRDSLRRYYEPRQHEAAWQGRRAALDRARFIAALAGRSCPWAGPCRLSSDGHHRPPVRRYRCRAGTGTSAVGRLLSLRHPYAGRSRQHGGDRGRLAAAADAIRCGGGVERGRLHVALWRACSLPCRRKPPTTGG